MHTLQASILQLYRYIYLGQNLKKKKNNQKKFLDELGALLQECESRESSFSYGVTFFYHHIPIESEVYTHLEFGSIGLLNVYQG